MNARIYLEGGVGSKSRDIECRKGFGRLLEKAGFSGRMPQLKACGGRNAAFDAFMSDLSAARSGDFVALLVDSEDPVSDLEQPAEHLRATSGWSIPAGISDDRLLLMVTCMETWILADRNALESHYRGEFLRGRLLPDFGLESRLKSDVQDSINRATERCPNRYEKGKRSFEILGKLDPEVLRAALPSFERCLRILDARLPRPPRR